MTKDKAIEVIEQACEMLGHKYKSPEALRIMLAIGYQESGFKHREQINGPAKGFWQFERHGGVAGVLHHPATKKKAAEICVRLNVPVMTDFVYGALASNDLLAACFARLLLWTLPGPIPSTENEAWDYYIDGWRPGKPHRNRWTENWQKSAINSL